MIISLCGFMGSGKTTVGKVLADILDCPFWDLDDIVEKKAGKTIAEIFATEGEPAFRQWETRLLRQTLEKYGENTVILALGGGTVLNPASASLLQEKTTCIYLRASLETLLQRLEGERDGRPLADENLARRLTGRLPLYEATAHVTVDTDGLTPEEIADEIVISCL